MTKYIWQQANWPNFFWDTEAVSRLLIQCRQKQSYLLGAVNILGFDFKLRAQCLILEQEVLKTAAIEGEKLDPKSIRSSVARQLGLADAGLQSSNDKAHGVVEVLLDAARHYNKPLSADRIQGWHAALFPDGYSGFHKITVGDWRQSGMEILSGPEGKQVVHFTAPPADVVASEMKQFLNQLNNFSTINSDGLIRAALIHFWFVTIHPFDDGNGRIARALTDMALAQDEKNATRFYSLSNQIMKERDEYYAVLESCQKGAGDITAWQVWFLGCFDRAVRSSQELLERILVKAKFWQEYYAIDINPRQKKVINKLLDTGKGNFEGNLAARNYRTLAKTTKATSTRDLDDLLKKGILKRLEGGGRSVRYDLIWEQFEVSSLD